MASREVMPTATLPTYMISRETRINLSKITELAVRPH